MAQANTSPFDAAAFLESTTNEAGATSVTPIPAGTYNAMIEDIKPRTFVNSKTQETGYLLDVSYKILDDDGSLREAISREPKLTHGYFMDIVDGKFDFAKGKNVQIHRVRDAVGQNVPGQPWMPGNLKGQALQIVVIEDPDKNTDAIFNRVKSVARLAV